MSTQGFTALPMEIQQRIAIYLPDRDLARLRLVCRSAYQAVDGHRFSLWRQRTEACFAPPTHAVAPLASCVTDLDIRTRNARYKKIYQRRMRLYRQGLRIKNGAVKLDVQALGVIRDLIKEARGIHCQSTGTLSNPNLAYLHSLASNRQSNLLHKLFKPGTPRHHPRFLAIQLALCWLSLELLPHRHPLSQIPRSPPLPVSSAHFSIIYDSFGFMDSQRLAYAAPVTRPLFKNLEKGELDLELVLHIFNFFKRHFTDESLWGLEQAEEGLGFFPDLPEALRPRMWMRDESLYGPWPPAGTTTNMNGHAVTDSDQQGESGEDKGSKRKITHWLTTFAYLDRVHLRALRKPLRQPNASPNVFVTDENVSSNDAFRGYSLEFLPPTSTTTTPDPSNPQDPQDFPHPLYWPPSFAKTFTPLPFLSSSSPSLPQNTDAQSIPFLRTHANPAATGPLTRTHFLGHIHPLPPQNGIHDWSLFRMVDYTFRPGTADIDPEWCFAYEGVLLPGQEMVLGRWWQPAGRRAGGADERGVDSGPVIWWRIERAVGTASDRAEDGEGEEDGEGGDGNANSGEEGMVPWRRVRGELERALRDFPGFD